MSYLHPNSYVYINTTRVKLLSAELKLLSTISHNEKAIPFKTSILYALNEHRSLSKLNYRLQFVSVIETAETKDRSVSYA